MSRLLLFKKSGQSKLAFVYIFTGFSVGIIALIRNVELPILLQNIAEEITIVNQHMSSIGYLSDKNGSGSEKISFLQKLKPVAREMLKAPYHSIQEIISPRHVNTRTLRITIPFKSEEILDQDRKLAIENGYLSNSRFTKAFLSTGEDMMEVRIRLKGDLPSHWQARKRKSLRVQIKGNRYSPNKPINFPYKEFSLHKPRSRQYPYEYLFSDTLRNLGLPNVKHEIVKVIVNNEDWGYMDLQEHFHQYLLERQSLKNSLIIRFGDELYWKEYSKNVLSPLGPDSFWLSHPRLFASVASPKRSKLNETQKSQFSYIMQTLLESDYQKILFNTSAMNQANALMSVWGNYHPGSNGNARYYFNPYTLQLEPILSDQGPFISKGGNPIMTWTHYSSGFINPSFNNNYDSAFLSQQSILSIKKQSRQYSDKTLFRSDQPINISIAQSNFNKVGHTSKIPKEDFDSFYGSRISCDNSPLRAIDLPSNIPLISSRVMGNQLLVWRLLCAPIEVQEVSGCGSTISINNVLSKKIYIKEPEMFNIDGLKGCDSLKLSYKLFDANKSIKPFVMQHSFKINPLIEQAIPEFVKKDDANNYYISSGQYISDSPIVIHGNLRIDDGVTIDFSENSFFVVKGNVAIEGSKASQITLKSASKDKYWKGMYIYSDAIKPATVSLSHLNILNTSRLNSGILDLTGAFSIYNADVNINNMRINHSKAEDGLNIIKSLVSVNNLEISDVVSDGFDCDFCEGQIDNLKFLNIAGDGLDLSGSRLSANVISSSSIGDKVLSVGERSDITGTVNNVNNSYVAVAVKDGSKAVINLVNVDTYGPLGMTYVKKPFLGGVTEAKFTSSSPSVNISRFKSSLDTQLYFNSVKINNEFFDVEKMYSEGPMKKFKVQ